MKQTYEVSRDFVSLFYYLTSQFEPYDLIFSSNYDPNLLTMSPQSINLKKPANRVMLIGIAIAVIAPLALTELLRLAPMNYAEKLFYSRFLYWADALFVTIYAYRAEKLKPLIWDEKKLGAGAFVLSVFVLYLLSIGCGILSKIPSVFGWRENYEAVKRLAIAMTGNTFLMVFCAVTAGFTEEFIFRGYILSRLSLMCRNQFLPILISAILFSALHYRYFSIGEFILTFMIGLVFGIYYREYRNIKALMVAHFLIDFISFELATHFYRFIK
ncbi:MAG TPA: type II CAAX endopeptidase family protein [Mucilaginibacter sp.]|nr:type II CAAX endopeptidase family protein [Mucilaginibacter sp.]